MEPTLIDKYRMKTKQDHLRVTSRLQERLAKEIYAIVTEQLEHEAKIGCFMPMYVEQDVKVSIWNLMKFKPFTFLIIRSISSRLSLHY